MPVSSKKFVMLKGDKPALFRILCSAARMLVTEGDTLKTQGIQSALDAWSVRPIEFAAILAGKPVPVEFAGYMGGNLCPTHCPDEEWRAVAGYMGGNLCPTHCPDEEWRAVAGAALLFRDTHQFLRCALRAAGCDGTLPKAYRAGCLAMVSGIVDSLIGEYTTGELYELLDAE